MMDRPTGRSARYEALDVWRGIVCLIVVLEHAGVCLWSVAGTTGPDGWLRRSVVTGLTLNLGAPLFFVISGYCIASSLESSRRKGTSPALFLARRLWRIFPPYWASVLAIAGLVMMLDAVGLSWLHRTGVGLELSSPRELDGWRWLGNITLTETWRPLFAGPYPLLINRVAWALCYQEQFYLICFLALILAPRRLHGALAGATLAIVAYRVFAWDSGRLARTAALFPDLWHEFAVGLALYWRINVARSATSRRLVELGMLALVGVGWSAGLVTTVASAGFGLLLIGVYRWDRAIARLAWLDPLRACGRRSYAIYLIHLPVCTVGNAALAAMGIADFWPRLLVMIPSVTAASVVAGWAFYRVVDRRFTKLPTSGRPARPREPEEAREASLAVASESPSGIVPSWTS